MVIELVGSETATIHGQVDTTGAKLQAEINVLEAVEAQLLTVPTRGIETPTHVRPGTVHHKPTASGENVRLVIAVKATRDRVRFAKKLRQERKSISKSELQTGIGPPKPVDRSCQTDPPVSV
jgi:hypothetical protein